MSGNKKGGKSSEEKKPLSHGWIVVPSKTYPDRVYFYNTVTKCSTWENPCGTMKDKSPAVSSSESSSPVRSRSRKNKSRSKRKRKKNGSTQVEDKASTEIEDYDEENDMYFENVCANPFKFPQSRAFSPPSSPEPLVPSQNNYKNVEESKSSGVPKNDQKELWLHFASSPENPNTKKSVALSDLDKPSTSGRTSNMSVPNETSKRSPRSHSLSAYNSMKIGELKKEIAGEEKKKKKKKRSQSETQKRESRSNIDKIINPPCFKKRDKTPAQTRLLKLREQNAKLIKKFADEHSKSAALENKNFDSFSAKFSSDSFPSPDAQIKDDSFSDAYLKRIDICNTEFDQEEKDQSATDFGEEMDWEPSTEELDVQNINEFRQQRDKANKISSDIFFGLTSDSTPLPSKSNSWILVLDTNILVSCLTFVKDLRDTNVQGLGFPLLYVPWRVLQELDHLKDSKINAVEKQLHSNVRKAISYLNENFKSRHPRCFGQSFEDFAKMVDVEASAPDDEILQTCLQLIKLHPDKKLTLLTNDKNLESKAIISGVEAFSKDRFHKKFMSWNAGRSNGRLNATEDPAPEIDNIVCGVKTILKNFIPVVVETEMKLAFEKDWTKLAYKKPPWTLQDAMDCFIKHWRSVFFIVFSRSTLSELETLYHKLFNKEPDSMEEAQEIVSIIQRLLSCIQKSLNVSRDYAPLIDETMTKISGLLEGSKARSQDSRKFSLPSTFSSLPQHSQALTPNGSHFPGSQGAEKLFLLDDVTRIKNLFRDIWDRLWNFCCSVSDIVNSSTPSSSISIPELRLKISQILNEVSELIRIVDEIFQVDMKLITEDHPLILGLSRFLRDLCPAMDADLNNRLPICLAAFFLDLPGRSVLKGSLTDFREFSRDLIKASEYFNLGYPTF